MKAMVLFRAVALGSFLLLSLSRCGIATYPGQPGFSTNGYSKIDMEYLDESGLFFYEVSYDNRPNGAGIGAIVTKLYPGARTYTSNVRTNADGTLFREKAQYDGAKIQMIAMPKLGQVMVSADSHVQFLLDYEDSLDEVDDANVAEKGIFAGTALLPALNARGWDRMVSRIQLLKAANLERSGGLSYSVEEVLFGTEKWRPQTPVHVETTFFLNAIRADLTQDLRKDLSDFVEAKFPKGFKGELKLKVKGSSSPLAFRLGINTLKTAAAAGIKIGIGSTQEEMKQAIDSAIGRHP